MFLNIVTFLQFWESKILKFLRTKNTLTSSLNNKLEYKNFVKNSQYWIINWKSCFMKFYLDFLKFKFENLDFKIIISRNFHL